MFSKATQSLLKAKGVVFDCRQKNAAKQNQSHIFVLWIFLSAACFPRTKQCLPQTFTQDRETLPLHQCNIPLH